jgi:type II secretory pathway component PulK
MKNFSQKKLCLNSPSFALISVLALVSLAALTATAFLASARLERQATGSIGSSTRLEMALNSGKACAVQVINDNSQADVGGNTHIVTYWRGGGNNDWTNELGYPFIGQTKASGANGQLSAQWYYFPLFSPAGVTNLDTNVIQTAMRFTNGHQGTFSNDMQTFMTTNATKGFVDNPGLNHPICVQIPLLGGRTSPPVGWVYLNQEKRGLGSALTNTSPAVRIAWFTEDLEGLIDAERMGASTLRATGTNSEEISLTSATDSNGSQIIASISTFTNARKAFISYGLLASSNVSGITNSTNARYFASGLRAWAPTNPASPTNGALAWIPAGIPVGGTSNNPRGYTNQGYTKFNLNNLATNSGSVGQAVTNIAGIITENLSTKFLARAGGLTNRILYTTNDFDYAKCLAANIVDYIDPDSNPTALDAAEGYRGTEALPYCTEFALRFRLEDAGNYNDTITNSTPAIIASTTNRINPSINAYLELWNPHATNIPLSTLGISFKSYGTNDTGEDSIAIGCNQFVRKFEDITTSYSEGSSGPLTNLTFNFATAIANNNVKPLTNALAPNAYCVIKLKHDYSFLNIGPVAAIDWRNTTNASGVVTSRFFYRSNSITKNVYFTLNTTNFQNDCMVPSGVAVANNTATSTKGLLELSFGGIVYDRARSFRFQTTTVQGNTASPDPSTKIISWSPSLNLYPNSFADQNFWNTGDPRISYFLRRSPLDNQYRQLEFSNTSFGGPNNSPGLTANSNGSFSTAPPTNIMVDVIRWPDGGHNSANYGDNPSGGTDPQTNSANEPILATIVATESNKAPAFIRNGPMTNICELGNIYDPILWRSVENGNITSNSIADSRFGGGNSLRIGRPEHPRFAFTNMYGNSDPSIPNMAQSSAALLDLFCLTNGTSVSGGPYSMGGGKINLNTAPAPVLRALAGGILLTNDPAQLPASYTIPPAMAEAFAQGVMRFRSKYPFLTPSHLSFIGTDPAWPNTNSWPSNSVFGNTNTIALSTAPGNSATSTRININEWNDQAAEEWFSKIYALSSCQSHNYRVYVVAQLVATNSSGETNAIGPLVKKYYQIYARNGSSAASRPDITTYPSNTIYSWQPSVGVIDIYKSAY